MPERRAVSAPEGRRDRARLHTVAGTRDAGAACHCWLWEAPLVAEIQPETLRSLLIHKATRGPKSRDNYRRALSSFFAWAQRQGYCADNPASKIDPIKAEHHEAVVLTVGESAALLQAAAAYKEGALLPYVVLGLFAGLRPTELARLEWSRVDRHPGPSPSAFDMLIAPVMDRFESAVTTGNADPCGVSPPWQKNGTAIGLATPTTQWSPRCST